MHRTDVIDSEQLERIAEELTPGTIKLKRQLTRTFPLVILGLAVILTVGYFLSPPASQSHLISAIQNPLMWVLLVGGMIGTYLKAKKKRAASVERTMLRHQRCPHCGYALDALPVDEST